MSRAWTSQEVREKFLHSVWEAVRYWASVEDKDPADKLEGLAFSLLSMLDGCQPALPPFELVPMPHADDMACHHARRQNYFTPVFLAEDGLSFDKDNDDLLATPHGFGPERVSLHEVFHAFGREHGYSSKAK